MSELSSEKICFVVRGPASNEIREKALLEIEAYFGETPNILYSIDADYSYNSNIGGYNYKATIVAWIDMEAFEEDTSTEDETEKRVVWFGGPI